MSKRGTKRRETAWKAYNGFCKSAEKFGCLKPIFWFNQLDDESEVEDIMASIGMKAEEKMYYQPFMA